MRDRDYGRAQRERIPRIRLKTMSSSYDRLFLRTTQGIKPGLDVISALLDALGNPHHRLAVVHVAGTNGKGSVCTMIESVLRASGFRTGLYTSPHLVHFSERFLINGCPIAEERLEQYIDKLEQAADSVADDSGLRPATFFEISTAIAFQYFADEGVDIAVVETGMGGRWDATNVVIPLVAVITRIDIDHTEYLGNTLEQIASEKAGIIKAGRPVVTAPQSEAVMAALRREGEPLLCSSDAVSVVKVAAPQRLKIETPSRSLPPINLPLLGECQRENCAVAVAALEILADMLGFDPFFKEGLESAAWAARFQTLSKEPLIVLDGAHNPSAARALASTLKENHPGRRVGFLFGFLKDKDSASFLHILRPLVSRAWALAIDAPRGMTADQAASQARAAGIDAEAGDAATSWKTAVAWAEEDPGHRMIVVAGSLYLSETLSRAGCI